MNDNESIEFFLRFLKDKHQLFVASINELLAKLVEENKEAKKLAAEKAMEAAITLKNNLSDQDVPGWLSHSIKSIDWYLRNVDTSGVNNGLLTRLIDDHKAMKSHQWKFDSAETILAFDFDSIYEKCKIESRLDELFDNIISLLQKIINSGEVDSIKTVRTLEKLIATLKMHGKASYFSLHSMYDFMLQLMKNVLWAQLESIPVLGPIAEGLRKTIEETGVELENLQINMKEQMTSRYESEFNLLNTNSKKEIE
jgi:hypothetical protein